jgi:hypothetical protein
MTVQLWLAGCGLVEQPEHTVMNALNIINRQRPLIE